MTVSYLQFGDDVVEFEKMLVCTLAEKNEMEDRIVIKTSNSKELHDVTELTTESPAFLLVLNFLFFKQKSYGGPTFVKNWQQAGGSKHFCMTDVPVCHKDLVNLYHFIPTEMNTFASQYSTCIMHKLFPDELVPLLSVTQGINRNMRMEPYKTQNVLLWAKEGLCDPVHWVLLSPYACLQFQSHVDKLNGILTSELLYSCASAHNCDEEFHKALENAIASRQFLPSKKFIADFALEYKLSPTDCKWINQHVGNCVDIEIGWGHVVFYPESTVLSMSTNVVTSDCLVDDKLVKHQKLFNFGYEVCSTKLKQLKDAYANYVPPPKLVQWFHGLQ
jgi:hypothetical protein